MIYSLSLLVLLALSGYVGNGHCSSDAASLPESSKGQESLVGSDEPGGRDEELKALLQKEMISLADMLRIAEISNPEVRSARKNVGAAAGHLWQSELYPNPTVEFEV